jgi:hypothetical protein
MSYPPGYKELLAREQQSMQLTAQYRQLATSTVAIDVPFMSEGCTKDLDDEEILINSDVITVQIDYPLKNSAKFKCEQKGGMTKKFLADAVYVMYKKIYQREAETTTIPVGTLGMMLNRNTTDGKYGIWGHEIDQMSIDSLLCVAGIWHVTNSS